jgi:hypothetical protein
MEMSSPPSKELLAVCVGEEWGGVGLQSMGSPVDVVVVVIALLMRELDLAESLHMTCNSTSHINRDINFLSWFEKKK